MYKFLKLAIYLDLYIRIIRFSLCILVYGSDKDTYVTADCWISDDLNDDRTVSRNQD